jgi:hypothetical protein
VVVVVWDGFVIVKELLWDVVGRFEWCVVVVVSGGEEQGEPTRAGIRKNYCDL